MSGDADLGEPGRYARYPSLSGRPALVTGGATGIGASIVAHLADQGAEVAFLDLQEGPAAALVQQLGALGLPQPRFLRCDLRDVAALRRAVDEAAAALGGLALLVNNAANDSRRPSAEVEPEDWDDALAVNVRPHFFATQAAAAHLRRAGGGSVVNLGSITPHADFVDLAAYIAAKSAIEGLTRTLARELGPDGTRVNCVLPGWIMTERQRRQLVTPEVLAHLRAAQCLADPLLPADVARLVLWLCADDSRAATGQRWVVDGGWT